MADNLVFLSRTHYNCLKLRTKGEDGVNEAFRITRIRRGAYYDMKASHVHAACELYYLVSGVRRMFCDDSAYMLHGGDMIFIPANAIHKTSHVSDRAHERIAVTFDAAVAGDLQRAVPQGKIEGLFLGDPVTHLDGEDRAYVERLLARMLSEYERQDALSGASISGCLQELMIFLLRKRAEQSLEFSQDADITDKLMQKAARFIRGNYMNDMSLSLAAGSVNLSPCYFSKRFKAATGFGYQEYLQLVRVQNASKLLLETNKSVTEIALECGFSDSNYFGDAFRREKGVSPLKYRKSRRAGGA